MNIQNIAILNPQVVIDKKAFILYNQSILKIEYCGDLSEVPIPSSTDAGLKISPICTAELQKLTSNSKAAEADAKFAAEKTSAELKAKQEADAKAAAELKAKQEADAKAAAELKAKQEADAKAAAELKTKQEAEAKAAADKATGEKIISDAKSEAARILAAAKAAAAKKKITITCFKGKLTKKVTAVKPVCPKGYKKK
jgi:HD-GYP domain-containing protein (c-di-GMP phosphodiesterase class II)